MNVRAFDEIGRHKGLVMGLYYGNVVNGGDNIGEPPENYISRQYRGNAKAARRD